jgi:hypothetical protein
MTDQPKELFFILDIFVPDSNAQSGMRQIPGAGPDLPFTLSFAPSEDNASQGTLTITRALGRRREYYPYSHAAGSRHPGWRSIGCPQENISLPFLAEDFGRLVDRSYLVNGKYVVSGISSRGRIGIYLDFGPDGLNALRAEPIARDAVQGRAASGNHPAARPGG